jgi:putative transposase
MILVIGLSRFLRSLFGSAAAIALENLALRHQLLVLQRSVVRPRLSRWDRVFWVWFSRVWASWRSSLVIVQPATVLAWHRQGFQLYWRWKSRAKPVGRPRLDPELRQLIRRMARENPTWGRQRIRAELVLLGYEIAELTVAKYMRRTAPRPSPTWRTFLDEAISTLGR